MATASRWVIIPSLQIVVGKENGLRIGLFVYGTLKRGFTNHDRFCCDLLGAEEATVRGRLYDLPVGYPALTVPEEDIRATGTTDYPSDAATRPRLEPARSVGAIEPGEGWDRVHGELFTFDDPESRFPALDALEGFVPDGSSFYRRVLLPVRSLESEKVTPAWAYVVDEPSGIHLPGGRWPAAC